ncbi:TfoX/Sxy family protein [Lentimicrobium sp. S6]|uniref:TfoX/Sxy family protein n=1 Tax=Lentimicrobium sp. S6 TaxID=2735872 RepID=UPI001551BBB3|nr:TfoX/Sxy family protein [Lentimicrobium sp. S6]NPD46339.1 TfoX/Sxy family protein [Lentimicrobium sp. S6]
MDSLIKLPNIGKILAQKLHHVEVNTAGDLIALGSENAIIKIAAIDSEGVCINMLYAIEGAIQNIRWHDLPRERKKDLKLFFQTLNKS